MPDTNAPATLPQLSKRYRTESVLGQGGMGVVYRAYDNVTKRPVAVKTMWGDIDPASLELFEREWTVLARLSHPNIVDILDTGEFYDDQGQRKPYFVMPLLPGKTLDEIIKTQSQRLTVNRVVEIMCQACRGLQAAHDQNLVHRDLKPSNIFVMDDDTAKIIDFGVAHLADAGSVTGIKGTPQYMAPEQADMANNSQVSPRADIFSLAVVCYEALTGRKPFARRTIGDTVEAIRTHVPPPASEINGSVNNLVARTIHKAMAKHPWHRFSSAREFADTLQRALRNEPIEYFDRAKTQPKIERIKKAYQEGDHQFAMEMLTELESEGHIDPEMPVLRMQIEQSIRQKTIRQLLESARTRLEGDEHPLALQKVGEVLVLDPDNIDALSLRSQIERQRSQKQIEQWFRLVEEHRDNQVFSQARQGLQEILKIDNSNTRARTMLAEIDQTEQSIIKFREEKQRLYEGALASYRNGEISSALSKLERGLELSRGGTGRALPTELDAQYQSFYNQVRSQHDAARNAYAEGRKCLEEKNTARALEICEEYLAQHAGDHMFQALKLEAEEMQRQEESAAIAEVNRRADSEPDLEKKFNIVKDACARFPNEQHFKSSLKLIRDRRDLVNSIVARARNYEERAQFAEANTQWDILRNIYPVYPGLDFEVQRLARRREENAHAEAKAHFMERIDSHLAEGDYARARAVIQEALKDFPGDKELSGLETLAEQGLARSTEASALWAQGRALCEAKNFNEGLDALRKAERLDPRNAAGRATLLSYLVEQARELISSNWRAAEALIREAAALNAQDPAVRSLQSQLESQKRQESIDNILVAARGFQAAGDISAALKKVQEGLARYPNEVRLLQLQNTLKAAVASTVVAPKPEMKASASDLTALGFAATSFELDSLQTSVEPKPALPPPPPLNKPPAPPPPTPSAKKPLWLMAIAAAVVIIFASMLYSFLYKGHGAEADKKSAHAPLASGVKVNLTANQPGAIFKVDGVIVTSGVMLKPGEHTAEAELDGFSSDVHPFVVNAGASAPVSVNFTLNPALPEIRLSSGLSGGSVILDDNPPVDLQEGAFIKNDIPFGDHRVRVMDGNHETFSFAFHSSPRQLMKLTSPLTSRSGSGIIVSSLAGAAQLYSTPGMKGAVAGQAPQPIAPDGLAIPAASPPQKLSITDGTTVRELSLDPSPLPVLVVMLNGGLEKIPVTIAANVPDASVSIDGNELKRKMVNGARIVPLVPGSYSVTVAHDGYQPSAAQILKIKAGDQAKRLDFQLTAIPQLSSLVLSGSPVEGSVFLDDVRAGTINAAGGFTKDVSPGNHVVVVKKSGFDDFKQAHDFKAGDPWKLSVQLHPSNAAIALHVTPLNAKITLRRDAEISTPANGQTISVPPGNYLLTATADDFVAHSENILVELGKPLPVDWVLAPLVKEDKKVIPFENAKSWKMDNNWLMHSGGGVSFYNGGSGTHVFDLQRRKGKLGIGTKRIVFYADFSDKGNYTQYSLDGRNLWKRVFVDNVESDEVKMPFGQDTGETIRMTVELSPNAFTVKNRAGSVVDTIRKSNIGKFAFVDDVTLHLAP